MSIIEILKTFSPLVVSILVVILNHFFSLSKTKKEIKNKTDIEEYKERKEKAFELISSLLSFERLDNTFINKMSMALFSNYQLTPDNNKELESGEIELNNELLRIRSIVHFYFPELLDKCEKIEELHDKNIMQFVPNPKNESKNEEFAKTIDSTTKELHSYVIEIINYLRKKYNSKKLSN